MTETITNDTPEQNIPPVGTVRERAEWWYNRGIRQRIETRENLGKYLVLNPETGEYVMSSGADADDDLDVSLQARDRFGTHRLYLLKIGYPAVDAIGAALTPYEHLMGEDAAS